MQIGQHCVNGSTIWRFISVPMAGGPATEIATGTPAGGFLADSFTAQLIPAKDGTGFLMTVPSGLDRNTVQLVWIKLDGSTTALLEGKHVLVDRFGEVLSEGRHLLLSEDGTAVAFVTTTGNNIQTLWMLDLTTLGGQPVSIQEQGANERIFHYVWAPGNTLYYAAGAVESDSLYKVQMGSTPQRVTRGRFFRLVTSAAGDKIAAAEWYANPNSIGDDLFQLQVLDLNGNVITLKQGDDSHNQIIPLAVQ
jgi:hypothetical protein